MLELYDQTVRTSSGGEMSVFLNNLAEKNRAYVRTRIGVEAEQFWYPKTVEPVRLTNTRFLSMRIKRLREKLATWIVHLVAGKAAAQSFQLGLFRSGGEVHQWMYDRYSLARLLKHAGFGSIKICTAHESRIAKYEDYSLDVLNGAVRKPDSLYIEASKP
jgi:hypothetical protein